VAPVALPITATVAGVFPAQHGVRFRIQVADHGPVCGYRARQETAAREAARFCRAGAVAGLVELREVQALAALDAVEAGEVRDRR